MKKYILNCNKYLLRASEDLLFTQLNKKEPTGTNDGDHVKQYLLSVGINTPNPYCMAGQYWCFAEAAKILKIDPKTIPIIKTGLAIKCLQKANLGTNEVDFIAQEDDLLFWIKPNGINGHVERIIKVLNGLEVETIGFNTSNGLKGNQREGDGNFKRIRNLGVKLGDMKVTGLIGFKPI